MVRLLPEATIAKYSSTFFILLLGGPDRLIDWLDTWKEMERVFGAHPDKVKAIGKLFSPSSALDLPHVSNIFPLCVRGV